MRQRIRLPITFKKPQFPTESSGFRLANGVFKNLSTVVRNTYLIETDQLAERFHRRLVIALSHDDIEVESDRLVGGIAKDGDYQIDWQDFLYYPLAKAEVQVQVTPFDATNDNCAVWNEYAQLDLEDDSIYGDLEEGEEAEINVFSNDSICCSPVTAEIVYTNSTYVDSASIDETTGIVTIQIKDITPTATDQVLVTYRVTCPNGQYDEADIYGSVNGSEETCEPVTNLAMDTATETTATILWTASGSPVTAYMWALYEANNPGVPVQTGSTTDTFVNLDELNSGTDYIFEVIVDCAYNPNDSVSTTTEFATLSLGNSCGVFTMTNDGFPSPSTVAASYMDCNGIIQSVFVGTTMARCMMMDSPGVPTYLVIHPGGSWVFDGICGESVMVFGSVGASQASACFGSPTAYYVAAPYAGIESGVYVYNDSALTSLLGDGYIKNDSGEVFIMTGGLVGSSLGSC